MLSLTPTTLLVFSAALHALWNASTKLAADKDMFVFLTIALICIMMIATLDTDSGVVQLGGSTGLTFAIVAGLCEGGYLVSLARAFARTSLARAYSIMRGGAMVIVWTLSVALKLDEFSWSKLGGSAIILLGIFLTAADLRGNRALWRQEMPWPLAGALFIAGYHICYGESLRLGAEPRALFLTALGVGLPFLFLPVRRQFLARAIGVVRRDYGKLVVSTLGAGFGFVIFLYGLKASGPGAAISLRNSSIFFSLALSFLIRDRLTFWQILGGTVVGIGAVAMSL